VHSVPCTRSQFQWNDTVIDEHLKMRMLKSKDVMYIQRAFDNSLCTRYRCCREDLLFRVNDDSGNIPFWIRVRLDEGVNTATIISSVGLTS